jgi:hypothetical protein
MKNHEKGGRPKNYMKGRNESFEGKKSEEEKSME